MRPFQIAILICSFLSAPIAASAKSYAGSEVIVSCGRGNFKGLFELHDGRMAVSFKDDKIHRVCGGYVNTVDGYERSTRVHYKPADSAVIKKFFADDLKIKKGQLVKSKCAGVKFTAEILDISSSDEGNYVQLLYYDAEAERVCGLGAYHFATNAIEAIVK